MTHPAHQKTTSGGQRGGGGPAGACSKQEKHLRRPEMVGRQSSSVTIVDERIIRIGDRRRAYMLTQCMSCGEVREKSLSNLLKEVAGCRKCGRKRHSEKPCLGVPRWLLHRCISARQRCTNENDRSYPNYGGRGITFDFKTPSEMGRWIMDNIPNWSRDLQIDRIDNNKGYAPGNIRMVRPKINMNNQRASHATRMAHVFMVEHPHVNYAQSTLIRKIKEGMSFEEILKQWGTPSSKPKGVYGISLTPDPEIASLAKAD